MATPTIGGNPDPAQIANTTNSVIRDVQAMQDVQVFKDDTGTRRVLMGRGPNGFYGMKVSQTGNDVYDATADQLVFNSDNNLFKIYASGTATIPSGSTPATDVADYYVDVAHDLGFAPIVLAYSIASGDSLRLFGVYNIDSSNITGGYVETQVATKEEIFSTTTYVRFYAAQTNATGSPVSFLGRTVRYYILQETAS